MKIIAIAGEPATGKSFLMRGVLERVGFKRENRVVDIPCTIVGNTRQFLVLGQYPTGSTFSGTDMLSMNIQPAVVEALCKFDEMFQVLLFEGDRLFNGKFLETIKKMGYPLKVFYLKVSEEEKKKRHTLRNDSQTKEWLQSRNDKISYIMKYNRATGNRYNVVELINENLDDLDKNVKRILEELR